MNPECVVRADGRLVDTSDLPWGKYRKTQLAEAVQMDVPFTVKTLEGVMDGKAGDYLMRGPAGELYPCDRTIFAGTYEPAGEGFDAAS